jgi:cobalamin synthase
MGISSFILLPILIAAGFVLKAAATRRIGGVTGDILGAANETGELLFLLFAAIIGAAA